MSNSKFYLLLFCSIFSVCSSTATLAENPSSNHPLDFYIGLGAGELDTDINGEELNIGIAKIKAGFFIKENIALEMHLGQGLQKEKTNNGSTSIEVDSWSSTMIRLQSPHLNGFRIYFGAGYSELEASLSDASLPSTPATKETSYGATWSAGMEQQFSKNFPLWLYLDYLRINDNELKISIVDAGIRLSFQ